MASIMLVSTRQRPEPEHRHRRFRARGIHTDWRLRGMLALLLALGAAGPGARRCARGRARSALRLRERRPGRVPAVRARQLSGQRRHPRRARATASRSTSTCDVARRARAALLVRRRRRRLHAAARAAPTTRSASATWCATPRSGDQTDASRRSRRRSTSSARVDAWPILVEPQLDGRQLQHQRARRRAPRPPVRRACACCSSGPTTGTARSEWYTWSLPAVRPLAHLRGLRWIARRPGAAVERDRPRCCCCWRKQRAELRRSSAAAAVDPAGQHRRRGRAERAAGAQDLAAGARLPRHVPGSRLTARTVAIFGALVIAPLLHRLSVLAGVPQPRHRQLVQGRDQAGPERCAGAVARPRWTCACASTRGAPRCSRDRSPASRTPPAGGRAGRASARSSRRARDRWCSGRTGAVLAASMRERARDAAARNRRRTCCARCGQAALREPRAAGCGRLPHPHGRAASRDDAAPTAGALRGGASIRCRAQLAALVRCRAALLFAVRRARATLREPLKNSFRLTLTLVLLLAMLAAIYVAIYSAQRLVRPVQDLIAGTRAVGKGDFGTRLPLPSRDEMGFLVHSFNDMTKRLRRARDEATRSQQAVERERERLAIILARLSTGVLVDRSHADACASPTRRPAPSSARDLAAAIGQPLPELAAATPRLGAVRRAQLAARLARRATRSGASRSISTAPPDRRAAACAPARRCPARPASAGLRDRVRRHHRAAAGAARRCLGRGGAAPGARDQESAHAHPARPPSACAAGCSRSMSERGRADPRARHAHHRAAGRDHARPW